MFEKDISIIVPIYNTEKYLNACVQSVLEQTYINFELILIDDGSTDKSKEICKKFCEEDRRIRYIYQEHKGVSAARNVGIEKAVGKYLFFLDSDDFIHPQLLEVLYRLQEDNKTTVATVGFCRVREDLEQRSVEWKKESIEVNDSCYLSHAKALNIKLFSCNETRLSAIGGKLILRKAVQEAKFDERLAKGEDTLFLFEVIAGGADVTVLFREWYYYRQTMGGRKKIDSIDFCKDKYRVMGYMRDYKIKNHEMIDAKCIEWIILCEFVKWKRDVQRSEDYELIKYIEQLIAAEKKTWIFSQIDFCRKTIFCIGCAFYPFYGIIETIWQCYLRKQRKINVRTILL